MTPTRSRRRNPYRPGTAKYASLRQAALKSQVALARATAARAKSPQARALAKRQASAAKRALEAIKKREEFRSKLNEADRTSFGRLPIKQQRRLLEVTRIYPESVPKDLPDPFVGQKRGVLWPLYYATRTGVRLPRRV